MEPCVLAPLATGLIDISRKRKTRLVAVAGLAFRHMWRERPYCTRVWVWQLSPGVLNNVVRYMGPERCLQVWLPFLLTTPLSFGEQPSAGVVIYLLGLLCQYVRRVCAMNIDRQHLVPTICSVQTDLDAEFSLLVWVHFQTTLVVTVSPETAQPRVYSSEPNALQTATQPKRLLCISDYSIHGVQFEK